MKNRKILATIMALGMVTMGFALLVSTPVAAVVPVLKPLNGVAAPIVTDNQQTAFTVAGVCDVAVDVSVEVGMAADFAIGQEYDKHISKILKHIESKPEKAKSIIMDVCAKIERTDAFKAHLEV